MPGGRLPRWKATCSVSAKKVGRRAVEHQPAHWLHLGQLLRHDLGGVEQVDAGERLLGDVGEDLQAELPLGVRAGLDRVVQVPAMKIGVDPADQLGLLPGSECTPSLGFQ
jgi:hypothetical protein